MSSLHHLDVSADQRLGLAVTDKTPCRGLQLLQRTLGIWPCQRQGHNLDPLYPLPHQPISALHEFHTGWWHAGPASGTVKPTANPELQVLTESRAPARATTSQRLCQQNVRFLSGCIFMAHLRMNYDSDYSRCGRYSILHLIRLLVLASCQRFSWVCCQILLPSNTAKFMCTSFAKM